MGFFQNGLSMVLVKKNSKIFHSFRFSKRKRKIGQENVFDDILERKKAVLDHKKRV